jgi:glutamate/tyrosine decarboxylase-like PLP-dependent enzyme
MNRVFTNVAAAYLSDSEQHQETPSPLNMGIENSRRFRALPVYATLHAYGRDGYRAMFVRQISLARKVARWLDTQSEFQLLPEYTKIEDAVDRIFMIVMFRARDDELNQRLVKTINATSKIFVSGSRWEGAAVTRIAISNWRCDVERDFGIITEVLGGLLKSSES